MNKISLINFSFFDPKNFVELILKILHQELNKANPLNNNNSIKIN